jgi:RNA polymerase sigma factor (sigma-70 family)
VNSQSQIVVNCLRSLLAQGAPCEVSDAELLQRFVETRDNDAFSSLVLRHGPMVLGLSRRIVRDFQLAEDVFQATFLVLARKAPAIRGRESLAAWLHSVAVRMALRAQKSRLRYCTLQISAETAHAPDPLDELSAREFLKIIDEELDSLPEKYRLPIILCHLEGLTQEETVQRLGLCPGTLKGRLERRRKQLRARLQRRGLSLGSALAGLLALERRAVAVPPGLWQSTLRAALGCDSASPAAVALAQSAMKTMVFVKLRSLSVAVVLIALVGWGTAWMALALGASSTAKETPAAREPNAVASLEAAEQPRE